MQSSAIKPNRELSICDNKSVLNKALVLNFSLTAGILVLCVGFSSFKPTGVVALVAVLLSIVVAIKSNPHLVFKYLAVLFAVFANLAGCFVIEYNSMYLEEMSCYSGFSGSFPLLAFARWLFLFLLFVFDGRFEKVLPSSSYRGDSEHLRKSKVINSLTWVVLATFVVMYIHVLPVPSFAMGLTRSAYAARYLNGLWNSLNGAASYLMIIPLLALRTNTKKVGVIAISIYLIYLFWVGNKFGAFFTVLCALCLVYYPTLKRISPKQVFRSVLVIFVAFCMLICFTAFAHSFTSDKSSFDFLYERLSQQGQLWWKMYQLTGGVPHPGSYIDEISSIASGGLVNIGSADNNVGIYKVMYLTVPSYLANASIVSGSRYTEAAYAVMYYYFGIVGLLIFSILMSLIVSFIQNKLIISINNLSIIRSLIYIRFSHIMDVILSMHTLYELWSILTFISLAYLFITRAFRNRKAVEHKTKRKRVDMSNGCRDVG